MNAAPSRNRLDRAPFALRDSVIGSLRFPLFAFCFPHFSLSAFQLFAYQYLVVQAIVGTWLDELSNTLNA